MIPIPTKPTVPFTLLLLVLLAGGAAPLDAQERVDLLLHDGKVFTADDLLSIHEVVAIDGGRIVAVGGEELLDEYVGEETIDLDGRLVVPGFNDVHTHMSGDPHWYIDLTEVESIREIQELVREKAADLGPGEWITGYGWSEDELEEQRRPLRWDLDEAAPDNPVILTRAGGHSAVSNSEALRRADVDEDTPQPEGGIIEREDDGRLNGVIRERQDLVGRLVPEAAPEDVRESFVANLRDLFSLGITSIVQAGEGPDGFAEWETTYRMHRGELPRAAVQFLPAVAEDGSVDRGVQQLREFGRVSGEGDEWFRVGPMKVFVDGGFTGPAAWTLEPYPGQPDYYGVAELSEEQLYQLVKAAHDMGWQGGFHTIGDAAIEMAVDVFARVLEESPRTDHRHYLTHFTVRPPEATLRKMAVYNILIAQQPNFTYTLEGRYVRNLTEERAAHNNPVRSVTDHGIFMAFSSDILPIGPMVGIYAAVTRKGMSGRAFAAEEEAISVPDAIARYTRNGAYLTGEEDLKGTLEPGKLADLAVLNQDILTIDPERILETRVDLTILGGEVVYEREAVATR